MATYRWAVEFSLPGVPIARPVTLGAMQLTPASADENGHFQSIGSVALSTDQYLEPSAVEANVVLELELVALAAGAKGGSDSFSTRRIPCRLARW